MYWPSITKAIHYDISSKTPTSAYFLANIEISSDNKFEFIQFATFSQVDFA